MTAVGSERLRIIDRFYEYLAPRLPADTTLSPYIPGDTDTRPRMIWFDLPKGDLSVPAFTGDRLPRDDEWEVQFIVRVMGIGHDVTTVRDTHAAMLDAIDDLCAEDPNLTDDDALVSMTLDRVEGPVVRDAGPNGLIAVATSTVAFHTRLI